MESKLKKEILNYFKNVVTPPSEAMEDMKAWNTKMLLTANGLYNKLKEENKNSEITTIYNEDIDPEKLK